MPLDANAFNNTAIVVFFTDVNVCAMTWATFAYIKLEIIFDPSNLKDFDKENLGNTSTNMHHPLPKVSAGVSVPV